jgi:uncharacterized paraquat-inducible protein A
MRKVILVLALCLGAAVTVTSCKDKEQKHSEESYMQEDTANEQASMDVYQCPMDCEKGKTYDEEGKCPVCGMALKKVETELDSDSGHDENHDAHEEQDSDS